MPRKPRIVEPGVPMHITQRGNNREIIFQSDEDKAFYIKTFIAYKRKFRVKLYAWCLMDNHVHFVLEPKDKTSIGKLFHRVNTKYVQYYNRKHGRSGRLFGGRCYSCLLDDDHLYEAVRYVELNPTRAQMENEIGTYQWTSARERLKLIKTRFLSCLACYFKVNNWMVYLQGAFEKNNEEPRVSWEKLKSHFHREIPLGDATFIERIEHKFKRIFPARFRSIFVWDT